MNKFLGKQMRIGIVRGGDVLHEASLKSGASLMNFVLENMYPKWKPMDVYIDRNDVWHLQGIPIMPSDLFQKFDIVWNTASPKYTNILKKFSIPTIGHSAFTALLSQNPEFFSNFAKQNNFKTVRSLVIPVYQPDFDGDLDSYLNKKAQEVWKRFSPPWVVKSYNKDESISAQVVKTFPKLLEALRSFALRKDSVLIEELIQGKVATLHTVSHFRNQPVYHFPVISDFKFSDEEKGAMEKVANLLYQHLGGHYLKLDFVIHPRTEPYLLGFAIHPDIRDDSLFQEACKNIGTKASHVFESIFISHK